MPDLHNQPSTSSRRLWVLSQEAGRALLCAFGVVLALLGLGSCAQQAPKNVLTVYSAGPRPLAEKICEEFARETGIRTELFSATTGEIMARLEAEKSRPRADVVILASQTSAEVLKESGVLAPLPAGNYLTLRPEWNDADGYYASTGACALGVAVKQTAADPQLDWNTLLSPDPGAADRRLVMPSPAQSGSSAEFVVTFSLEAPELFWKGMAAAKERGLQVSGPNSQAISSLVLGANDAVVAVADYLVFKEIERGEPLAMLFPPSGCPVSLRPVMILKDSRNPVAAAKFAEFCFSREIQEMVAATHLIPADPEVPVSSLRAAAPPLNMMLADIHASQAAYRSVLRRFRYEIEFSSSPK